MKNNAEILENPAFYNQILNSVQQAIIVTTPDGAVVLWNKFAEQLYGYKQKEVLGKNIVELLTPAGFETQYQQKIQEAANSLGLSAKNEYWLKNKAGRIFPAIADVSPIAGEGGEVIGLVGISFDITEKKAAQKQLRDSEHKYRMIAENTSDGIFISNAKGRITYVSPAYLRLLGYSAKEELTHGIDEIYELVHPDERDKLFARIYDAIENNVEKLTYSFRARHKKGHYVWREDHAKFRYDDKGKLIETYVICRDITENKRQEQLLKQRNADLQKAKQQVEESEHFFRTIFENSPILYWEENFSDVRNEIKRLMQEGVSDINLYFEQNPQKVVELAAKIKVANVNQMVWKTFGYRSKAELLDNLPELFTEKSILDFKNALVSLVNDRPLFQCITEHRTARGDIKHMIMKSFVPEGYENNYSRIIVAMVDITEMIESEKELIVAKEKAEESDRLKSAFLRNISHEIRTPMNAMVGFSDLLLKPARSEAEMEQFNGYIHQSTKDLLAIVENIVAIAHIETGQLKLNMMKFPPVKLLEELHNDYSNLLEKTGKSTVEMKINIQADCEFQITSDYTRIQQIFKTLLDNALKFTTEGYIELGCTLCADTIDFYVSDTGIGIPKEKQQIIFKAFTHADENIRQLYGGVGIGLTIAVGLTKLLGGQLKIDSKMGEGTKFQFNLPLAPARQHNKPAPVAANKPDKMPQTATILVAEDEVLNYVYIFEILEDTNLKPIHAQNGKLAVELFSKHPVDLVLMDLKMPEMDGFETLEAIREINPTVPVIAQSAFAYEREECLSAGFTDYIAKPFNEERLLKKIYQHLVADEIPQME